MNSYKSHKEKIKRIIEKHEIPYKHYGFYMLPRLLNYSEKLNSQSSECEICKRLSEKLEKEAVELPDIISDNFKRRKQYEMVLDESSKHLRKAHNLMPARYYMSLYTVLGLFFGLAIGFSAFLIFENGSDKSLIFGSVGAGIILGYVAGALKDLRNKKRKRVL